MSESMFALFGNQEELEAAAEKLHQLAGARIQIVDQDQLGDYADPDPNSAVLPGLIGVGVTHGTPTFVSSASGRADFITSYLKDLDIEEAEARFLAQAMRRGGSLMIVDVEDSELSEDVQQIMRQANAVHVG